jgi:hypothetical protein
MLNTRQLFESKILAIERHHMLCLNLTDTVHALPTFFFLLIYKITLLPLMIPDTYQTTKWKRQKNPWIKGKSF